MSGSTTQEFTGAGLGRGYPYAEGVCDPAQCYIRDIMSHPSPRSPGNPAASGVLLYIRTK